MRRVVILLAAAFILALGLAACAEEEEAGTATPTLTPAQTASPPATATPQATATPLVPTPTPGPPSPQVSQPTWTIFQLSSAGQVQIVLEDGLNTYTVASVDPESLQFERWDIELVVDVNGDGVDDVVVNHFTGGAHCCFEYFIFSEEPNAIHLDDSFLLGQGNATIRAVQDLDVDGVPELEAGDDRLAYFPELSYAESPFLPLVLCRSAQGVYYDCTDRFPDVLESSAREFEGQLRDAVERQAEEQEKRPPALGLFASYLRLELAEEAWSGVRSLCPECEDWLRENYNEIRQRLSTVQPSRGWEGS